ncbi:MAG: hypothetical protein B7Y42_14835 [Polaromonas sp. 28-63-22]|nr:MAG: hypothetical protein B7Y42_14835 [Polaromonas sp. 28-63-22]
MSRAGVFEGQVCFAGLCVLTSGGVTAAHHAAAFKDTAPAQRPDFARRAIARHRARQRGEEAPGHCVVSPVAMAASLVRKLGSGSGNQGPARWLEKMNEKRLQPIIYLRQQLSNK